MKKSLTILMLILVAVLVFPTIACAESSFKFEAKSSVLMSEDGQVLLEHNKEDKRPIASMTKIMTLLCVYDAINNGEVALTDNVVVSERASSMGGSQVYLDANATYKLENLIKSIVVCSANDSCVALAEHIAGSVENFVSRMNDKAKKLGLVATNFENCTGLPAISQYSCAVDVGKMMTELIKEPHYFGCASVWMEDFVHPSGRVTGMTNTNKLIRFYQGCDGGKTGYTCEAQHCLAATAKRGNTRVIAVVIGAPDSKVRFKQVSDLFNFAFANYENKIYLDCNSKIENLQVVGAKEKYVSVKVNEPLQNFGKKGKETCSVQYEVFNQLKAPLKANTVVGKANLVDGSGKVIKIVDIVTVNDVLQKSYIDYLKDIVVN